MNVFTTAPSIKKQPSQRALERIWLFCSRDRDWCKRR